MEQLDEKDNVGADGDHARLDDDGDAKHGNVGEPGQMGMDSNGMVGDDLRHGVTSGPMEDGGDGGATDCVEGYGPDGVGGMVSKNYKEMCFT